MDVFSLLKFWRISGTGAPPPTGDLDSSFDDEESFFDLVFTNPSIQNDYNYEYSPSFNNSNNNSNIFSFDSPNSSKTPQSPIRLVMLGFQNDQKKSNINVEEVKIGALLKRDNSLRCKLMTEKLLETAPDLTPSKRFSKEVVNKYLNKIKPSLAKVSKKNNEKSKLSEKSVTPSSSPASSVFSPRKEEKRGGSGAVFREVRKRLGKSRSANAILQTTAAMKNDDSAVEQQDGIQGAILHCKRSYNSVSQPICVLSRSGSAPSNDNNTRISVGEIDV